MERLYEGISSNDLQYIQRKRRDYISVSVQGKQEIISRQVADWAAIYSPFLEKEHKQINMFSHNAYYSSADVESSYPTVDNESRILQPFKINDYTDNFQIVITNTTTGVKIYDYAKSLTEETIPEHLRWQPIHHIEMLLVQNQSHRLKVFKRRNNIIILTNIVNNKLVKEILATFPSLFSILPLQSNENITNCLRAVIKEEPILPFFKEMLDARANEQNEKINKLLKHSLTVGINKNLNNVIERIHSTERSITSYESDLANRYETLQRLLAEKLGIESQILAIDSDESFKDLLEFIHSNNFIKNITMREFSTGYGRSEKLVLELEAPITLYEEEPLQRQITNLYQRFDEVGVACLDVLAEVFLKDKYQLYCTTYVGIDIENAEITSSYSDLSLSNTEYNKMMQPHLSYFNCWGDQKSNIRKALREGNITDAIQLMLISIQNINFTDTTVLNRWIERLQQSSYLIRECKCIKDQEDNWYTFKDIMNIISERNKPKSEINQPEIVDELEGVVE